MFVLLTMRFLFQFLCDGHQIFHYMWVMQDIDPTHNYLVFSKVFYSSQRSLIFQATGQGSARKKKIDVRLCLIFILLNSMFPQKSYNAEYRENVSGTTCKIIQSLLGLVVGEALRDGPSNGYEKRLINMDDNKQPLVKTMSNRRISIFWMNRAIQLNLSCEKSTKQEPRSSRKEYLARDVSSGLREEIVLHESLTRESHTRVSSDKVKFNLVIEVIETSCYFKI